MLYNGDLEIVSILLNVYEHMKKDYDYLLVVVGEPGTGKSRYALNLLETWYRVILQRKVTKDMISHVHQDYKKWLLKFKDMQAYDMNIFDESSRSLNALDFMTRVSKDLTKLFDVCRSKRFFSVVILPNFFRLNKALREDRLRGLVWVDKRGHYKFYTRKGIRFLSLLNDKRKIKSMYAARAFHESPFMDYDGVLLNPYLKQKDAGVDEVLDEIISNLDTADKKSPKSITEVFKPKVKLLMEQKATSRDIAKRLGIGLGTVTRCIAAIKSDELEA